MNACATPRSTLVPFALALTLPSCISAQPTTQPARSPREKLAPDAPALQLQAQVMTMADDYIAALGEAVYLVRNADSLTPRSRWLAQSFLRNGVGAAIDIAAGPSPSVSVLDLLVLATLQTWSFEAHWIPAGIGDAGGPTLARLRRAEADLWHAAQHVLSDDQKATLRGLIDAFIAENPDRTVVATIRFDEFSDARKVSSTSLRRRASGLLKEVGVATAAIDDARLLGERLLWYAGRYPYVLGEQAELSVYRMFDQPEAARLLAALDAFRHLGDALTARIDTIEQDIDAQRDALFQKLAAERTQAIESLEQTLAANIHRPLDDLGAAIARERTAAVDDVFGRLDKERGAILDAIDSRSEDVRGLLVELRSTLSASGTLAKELGATLGAVDRVIARFDQPPAGADAREPLKITDLRDAAAEAARAAAQLARVLELSNELAASDALDRRIASLSAPADALVDRLFWRALLLIAAAFAGLLLLRLVPRRGHHSATHAA